MLDEWGLHPDGAALPGTTTEVLPVRTANGSPTVLGIGAPDEHLVLRRWAGDGAVRLLRAPHRPVGQAIALTRELARKPADTVVHSNLHYGNVLAADRGPWLAIAARPVNGENLAGA